MKKRHLFESNDYEKKIKPNRLRIVAQATHTLFDNSQCQLWKKNEKKEIVNEPDAAWTAGRLRQAKSGRRAR